MSKWEKIDKLSVWKYEGHIVTFYIIFGRSTSHAKGSLIHGMVFLVSSVFVCIPRYILQDKVRDDRPVYLARSINM